MSGEEVRAETCSLLDRHCVPCEGGIPPLTDAEIAPLLAELGCWKVAPGGTLTKSFEFKDFMGPVRLLNEIAVLAEAEGHHPDLGLSWGRLDVSLSTHAIKGLSENDFVLAAKIDAAAGV